jgi:hypothetical protein
MCGHVGPPPACRSCDASSTSAAWSHGCPPMSTVELTGGRAVHRGPSVRSVATAEPLVRRAPPVIRGPPAGRVPPRQLSEPLPEATDPRRRRALDSRRLRLLTRDARARLAALARLAAEAEPPTPHERPTAQLPLCCEPAPGRASGRRRPAVASHEGPPFGPRSGPNGDPSYTLLRAPPAPRQGSRRARVGPRRTPGSRGQPWSSSTASSDPVAASSSTRSAPTVCATMACEVSE